MTIDERFEEFVGVYEPNIPRTEEISLSDIGDAMRAAWHESARQEREKIVAELKIIINRYPEAPITIGNLNKWLTEEIADRLEGNDG